MEAWLEAVNASAIFRDNGFGPEVTEGVGATDKRRAEAGRMPGVFSFHGRRMSRIQGAGGSGLQPGAELGL